MADVTFVKTRNDATSSFEQRELTPDVLSKDGETLSTGIPKPPCSLGGFLDGPTFFSYLKSIPNEHWPHLLIYIYSAYPIMKEPDNIGKASHVIDADWLLQEFGSGDYGLCLNDWNLPAKRKKTVCQVPKMTPFRLRNEAFPPKRDWSKVSLADPTNKEVVARLIREGVIDSGGNMMSVGSDPAAVQNAATLGKVIERVLDNANKPPQQSTDTPVILKMMDMAKDSSNVTTQLLLKQLEKNDPDGLVKLVAAIKELQPPPPTIPNNDKMFELLLKTQADASSANTAMLTKMMEIMSTQKPNGIDDMSKMFTIMASAKELFGADKGGDTWPGVVKETVGMLFNPDVVGGIGSIISAAKGNPQPTQPNPTTATPNGATPTGMTPQQKQLAAFLPLIKFPLMKFISDGRQGYEFGEWIFDSYGDTPLQELSRLGKDAIMQVLMGDAQLSTLPRLDAFVDELLNPPQEEEEITKSVGFGKKQQKEATE